MSHRVLWIIAAALPLALHAQQPADFDAAIRESLPDALGLYRDLLRLPNDAHHPEDIERLVVWLEDAFSRRGFHTERLPTAGSPLLLAEHTRAGAERTVLVYLQSDGQPVDPAAWDQPNPYEPVVKRRGEADWEPVAWDDLLGAAASAGPGPLGTALDPEWRVFARSASDSKGPVAQFLVALDVLERTGMAPPFNVKVIVDTEEELGSPHLPETVEQFRDRLAADALVIFDGPPHASGRPTLKFGARGIATVTLTTYGPRVPQHSGHYGNYAPNPAQRLAAILASLEDDAGRVMIPGWYDGVVIDDATRAALAAVPDDETAIRRALGIAMTDSVAPTLQEALQYPSLNVRGLRSAWVGDEVRTIIPATAVAELDVRLVAESDPRRLLDLLREHVRTLGYHIVSGRDPTEEERLQHPRLLRFDADVSYAAFRTPLDGETGRWLSRALNKLYGEPPIHIRTSGGSIPISPFVETLGVPAVTVPTVNPDNNQHSPNENLRIVDFVEGIRIITAVLTEPVLEADTES